jgi:O-antigen ligase
MRDMDAIGLILLAALSFFAPGLADPYSTPRIAALGLACLPALLSRRSGFSQMVPGAFVCLLAATIAALCAWDKSYAIFGAPWAPADGLLAVVLYSVVAYAAGRTALSSSDVAEAACWASLPMGVYAVAQRFVLNADPLLPANLPGFTRVASTQGGPVYLGCCAALVFVCAVHTVRRGRPVGFVALVLATAALAFARARGAAIGAAVGAAALFEFSPFVAVALATAGALVLARSGANDLGRIEVWKLAARVFHEHPAVGVGPGNFLLAFRAYRTLGLAHIVGLRYIQDHAHNDVLHVAATCGIIGLLAYAFLWWNAFVAVHKSSSDDRPLLRALLLAFFVVSKFNPVAMGAVALMAAVFGAGHRLEMVPRRSWISAVVAVGVVALTVPGLIGGFHFARGVRLAGRARQLEALQEFVNASEADPSSPLFAAEKNNKFGEVLPFMAPDERKKVAALLLDDARTVMQHHPLDPDALELAGKSEVVAAAMGAGGDLSEARRLLGLAQRRDRMFKPLMARRRAVARLLGDAAGVAEAERDMQHLDGR